MITHKRATCLANRYLVGWAPGAEGLFYHGTCVSRWYHTLKGTAREHLWLQALLGLPSSSSPHWADGPRLPTPVRWRRVCRYIRTSNMYIQIVYVCMYLCMYVCLSVYLSISLSIYLFIYLFIYSVLPAYIRRDLQYVTNCKCHISHIIVQYVTLINLQPAQVPPNRSLRPPQRREDGRRKSIASPAGKIPKSGGMNHSKMARKLQ